MDKIKCDQNKKGNKKLCKKVQLCKTPRYLPGSVDLVTLNKDLEIYNQHLYNIKNAVTKIDTKPPPYQPQKYIKAIKLMQGAHRLRDLQFENKELVKTINMINRNKGRVDTWNPLTYVSLTKWRLKETYFKTIDKENKILYKRLQTTKSQYPKEEHDKFYKAMNVKREYFQKYPRYKITTKDDELRTHTSISAGLSIKTEVERPRVFLELEITEGHVGLGRIVIELYVDMVPETANRFLQMCTSKDGPTYKYCPVSKIFKEQYLITDEVKDQGDNILLPENWLLRHSKAGVLSMLVTDGGVHSAFCLTLSEMPKLDGKYVVIGKVIRGADSLFKANDLGRKWGKPLTAIRVSRCGRLASH